MNKKLALNPWPSSPSNPPIHCLTLSKHEEGLGWHHASASFRETWGAKRLLEHWLKGADVIDGGFADRIELPGGVIVKGIDIKVWQHVTTAAELEWEIPEDYAKMLARIRHATWRVSLPAELSDDTPPGDDTPAIARTPKAIAAFKPQRPAKPSDMTTIGQLAEQLKIIPRVARGILRDSGLVKPEYGWAFSAAELPAITKLLKDKSK